MKTTENIYVLVTLHRGLIDQVTIHDDRDRALKALERFVTTMNPEDDDAAVFAPDGLVRNAKDILDGEGECDPYGGTKPIYIIGNPEHQLGFMVASPDDPLGFDKPAEALDNPDSGMYHERQFVEVRQLSRRLHLSDIPLSV